MTKREKTIGFVMVAVFVFWSSSFFMKKPKRAVPPRAGQPHRQAGARIKKGAKEKPGQDPEVLFQKLGDIISSLDTEQRIKSVELTKDPFKKISLKTNTQALTVEDMVLSGIMWEENSPIVVINEQILREGDVISGYQVKEIRQADVTLMKGTKKHILRLFSKENEK